ncbi:MAG: CdaR family protein [Treponema sp.]
MKVNRLIEKIAENWPAKVICFVMALFLYIFHHVSILDRKTFTVPLSVVADGGMYPMTDCPDYVRVTVRSTTENIAEALQADITASLDLTTYDEEGVYSVPVSVHLAPKLLLMDPFEVTVKPENVTIRMEEKALRYVPITPALSGEPAHGYIIKVISVEPETVQIIGPRSAVEKTKQIYTDKINTAGLTDNKSYDVALQNINSLIAIQSEKQLFHVNLTIEAEQLVRSFADVPVKIMFLSPRLEVKGIVPGISFDLRSTVSLLDGYQLDENAVQVDCSAIKEAGTYELPVQISLPSYFGIENKSADTVKVIIEEKSVTEEKTATDIRN